MRARERRARCRAVLIDFAMLWGFYALANPLLFDWYWPALWTALLVCLVAGALAWVPSRHSGEPVRRGAAAVPPLLLAAWLLAGTGLAWLDFARAARGGWGELASLARVGDPVVRRIDAYRRAAEWIDAAGGGDAVVLSAEIGALGYHHGGPILDAGGLVSPAALPFLPVPAGERASAAVSAIPRGLVRAEAPEFIVTHPVFAARSLLGWADFERRYALVHRVPLARPLWGRRQLLVYRRRGGA